MQMCVQTHTMKASLKNLHDELATSTPGTPVTLADLAWAIQAARSRAFSGPYSGVLPCACGLLYKMHYLV